MESNKQWKDLFNNDYKPKMTDGVKQKMTVVTVTKSDFMIIKDIIKSNNNYMQFTEKIPQSIIKKSIKNSYKKNS